MAKWFVNRYVRPCGTCGGLIPQGEKVCNAIHIGIVHQKCTKEIPPSIDAELLIRQTSDSE